MAFLNSQNPLVEKFGLSEKSLENLNERLRQHESYSLEEIEKIGRMDHRIFPEGYVLSISDTEMLRPLAMMSQVELKPPRQITSHRKYLGKLIVFIKKATLPLISAHLKPTFEGVNGLGHYTVRAIAKGIVERQALKEEIQNLKALAEKKGG